VQIENALTAHDSIREAAVVSVPDAKYGEVVGAWIIRELGKEVVSREDVRMTVARSMNPQVKFRGESCYKRILILILILGRMRRRGFGLLGKMSMLLSYRRLRVGRCRSMC
jgi:acyl-CoA synthetase (AMP-forming)/AMP-acid ligase II